MQKLVLEQMITISSSLVYEAKVRGDRFWSELDLVAANVMSLSAGEAQAGGEGAGRVEDVELLLRRLRSSFCYFQGGGSAAKLGVGAPVCCLAA